ncbi:DUF1697 domain-containing protein [Schumannella soli]|uniref:DUF1697 domain-containing protein n=1 Tax=Schumannella soli TaxID=2590779 RepID=A0A506Y397_9MICO|nr:DUF1697 domain-containing protein [Schumannella soli]TPW75907.1 DUF1697 domain-containing protein [Schumannella soli]
MQQIVFVRNVNVGQRGHPSTADLVGAFADAGFADAGSFQSNGTLVVEWETDAGTGASAGPAAEVLELAMQALAARTGLEREAFAVPSDDLVRILAADATGPAWDRRELTLHGGGVIDSAAPAVTREAAHRRCRIVSSGLGWTVLENERDRESNATPVIERVTGGPATSRGFPTLQRLLGRLA